MSDNSIYGQKSTLSDTDSALHINIEDQIVKYPDWQFPLLKRWNSAVFKSEVKSHKYEWTEKELRPVTAKVASATVASDATSMYVDTSGVFNVDDALRKPSGEIVIVTAVAGGTLLTIKHWAGTAEAMVLGNTVQRIGVLSPAGKKADGMVIRGPEDLFNYTSIMEDVVDLDGGQRYSLVHGDENESSLISDKQKELAEGFQSQLLVGIRNIDKEEKRHSLGGLKFMIDTYAPGNAIDFGGSSVWNTDASVTDKFDDAVEVIANQMGGKPTIYMGYKAMRKFKKINDDLVRTTNRDKVRGIGVVDTYLSQLGDLDIVQLRERTGVLDNLIFFVDEEKVGYKPRRKRGWFTKELAVTGDSYQWQVLGEYTVKVETPKVFSYLYNLGL